MDIFNLIYESYGGRKIEGVFKSLMILSLLLKQLIFSLYITPMQQPNEEKMGFNDLPLYGPVKEEISLEEKDETWTLLSIINLLETKPEPISAREENRK